MEISRRTMVLGTLSSGLLLNSKPVFASGTGPLTKKIPSTGEPLPLVGLGSWVTFNVGNDGLLLDESTAVIKAFFEAGGKLIDSSPMYGSSQATIGFGLEQLSFPEGLFSADKVWTSSANKGPRQMEQSRNNWGIPSFDLMQVHNLVAWERHLESLRAMKSEGNLRYIGVTTSHGRRHGELEAILEREQIDFVQLTYNPVDRNVENRLLPLALERKIAVIANRPFQRKWLLNRLENTPLPGWANEIGAKSWAQVILKYNASHPAITCSIPATSKVEHVLENLEAASEPLPDPALRRKIELEIERS